MEVFKQNNLEFNKGTLGPNFLAVTCFHGWSSKQVIPEIDYALQLYGFKARNIPGGISSIISEAFALNLCVAHLSVNGKILVTSGPESGTLLTDFINNSVYHALGYERAIAHSGNILVANLFGGVTGKDLSDIQNLLIG